MVVDTLNRFLKMRMSVLPACTPVHHVRAGPAEARRGRLIPGNGSGMWVLEIEPDSLEEPVLLTAEPSVHPPKANLNCVFVCACVFQGIEFLYS